MPLLWLYNESPKECPNVKEAYKAFWLGNTKIRRKVKTVSESTVIRMDSDTTGYKIPMRIFW